MPQPNDPPTITAVVATYNEEAHVAHCLKGLLEQEGLTGGVEILVLDGMSEDRTRDIVLSFPEYGDRIRLLSNPHRYQAYAWNEALRSARGQYFAMIVAHAQYGREYLAACLEVMQRTGAAGVGGVQIPRGEGLLGAAIAWAMSSPLGVGNARFRYSKREEISDTVFSIFAKVDTLQKIGGYDERIPFDEDADLNYRLLTAGEKLVTSPDIRVQYFVRRSLFQLARQMYRYGYWRRATQLKHPARVPLRTFAPGVLLGLLALSAILALFGLRLPALIVPAAYAGFLAVSTVAAVRRVGPAAALVPIVLATMHLAYGSGWWTALFSIRRMRRVFSDLPV